MPSTAAPPAANQTPSRHRSLWRILAGAGVGLLVSGIAALLAVFALDELGAFGVGPGYSSAVVTVAVVGGSVVLSAVLAAIVARASSADKRSLATVGGVMLGAVISLVTLDALGVQRDFDPSEMSQSTIDNRLAGLTNAHREAYYLGDQVDGMHLAAITKPGETLYFDYGRCLDVLEGECPRPLEVSTRPTRLFEDTGETARDCKDARMAPVLGVPAARVYNSVLVFTGSSIVTVAYYRGDGTGLPDRSRTAAFAARLRPVGQSHATGSLPPPDTRTQRFVDEHCGKRAR